MASHDPPSRPLVTRRSRSRVVWLGPGVSISFGFIRFTRLAGGTLSQNPLETPVRADLADPTDALAPQGVGDPQGGIARLS